MNGYEIAAIEIGAGILLYFGASAVATLSAQRGRQAANEIMLKKLVETK